MIISMLAIAGLFLMVIFYIWSSYSWKQEALFYRRLWTDTHEQALNLMAENRQLRDELGDD